jgi:hypothetical protein
MSATLHQPPGKPTQAHSTLRPLGKRLLTIIAITAISFSPAGQAQSPHPFVASEFEVPETLETEKFRLRMLTVNDVVKDFEAVTTSKEHLHDIWGPGWPDGLTLEQNLIDLGWHQKEFQRRRSFAYTVVAPDESRVLGCVYIYPTRKKGYDAEVYLWARQSELSSGMETELRDSVKAWIAAKWPFEHPVFPGTDLSWEEWEKLEEVKR